MNENYYHKLENRIDWALQHNKLTFQEIVRECKGAYPIDVLQILKSKKNLQAEKQVFIYERSNANYTKEFITEKIDNNPVLCSWYFSIPTCKKIVALYSWENKRILFLGMPRLFEYFAKNVKNAYLTLIDLDYYVVNKLKENYTYDHSNKIIYANINKLNFGFEESYDFIFLDPPWYIEYYDRWISQSYKMLNQEGGIIIFPLFQELTRPNAEGQRKYLLSKIRECAKDYLVVSDFIEYEIPTFENGELQNHGVILEELWKKADLIIANGIKDYKYIMTDEEIDLNKWHEVDIFNIRIFININESNRYENVAIRYLAKNVAYLKNPSRRNQELKLANMLTSRGQGYIVESTEKLLFILRGIKEKVENGIDIKNVLESIDMDNLSKKILFEIFGGVRC
ncbi:MAG: class I SAM-dependent methyltransferase [Lachnospiraceae bacterium]|nr:class I SAM-dependent methyltransferase [Lachnospiraceae bacterium]